MGDIGGRNERFDDGSNCNICRAFCGEAINACGDGWEGYRGNVVLLAQFDRAAIARGEQIILAVTATVPDWSDGVDDVFGLEAITPGDLGVTGGAAAQRAALGKKFGTGSAMDRAIDPAAAEQRRIGGVDDGVNAQCRYVGNDDFQPRLAELARGAAQA